MANISLLPTDTILSVAEFLDIRSSIRLSATCKRFNAIFSSGASHYFWKLKAGLKVDRQADPNLVSLMARLQIITSMTEAANRGIVELQRSRDDVQAKLRTSKSDLDGMQFEKRRLDEKMRRHDELVDQFNDAACNAETRYQAGKYESLSCTHEFHLARYKKQAEKVGNEIGSLESTIEHLETVLLRNIKKLDELHRQSQRVLVSQFLRGYSIPIMSNP